MIFSWAVFLWFGINIKISIGVILFQYILFASKMKISLVSYINTRPFIDGLTRHFSPEEVEINPLPPAKCAQSLLEKEASIALIPVGALLSFEKIMLMPNYCIGSDGAVNSVFIFSQKPIEQIDSLILDRHSRSSNGLAKILLQRYWHKKVAYITSEEKNFDAIRDNVAGVVIGDKALKIRDNYQYTYDLGEYWRKLTSLPFAFAVWAYYEDAVSPEMLARIQTALADGVAHRAQTALTSATEYGLTQELALRYLTQDIQYDFTYQRQQAVDLYLKWLREIVD